MPSKARVEQVRNKDKIIRIDKHWEYILHVDCGCDFLWVLSKAILHDGDRPLICAKMHGYLGTPG